MLTAKINIRSLQRKEAALLGKKVVLKQPFFHLFSLSMSSGPRANHFMMMVSELKVNLSQQ